MTSAVAAINVVGTSNPPEGEMINGLWNGKYNICDPRTVNHAERTDFIKSICGHLDQQEQLEDLVRAMVIPYPPKDKETYNAQQEIQELAQTYYRWKNKGARLPKFSRWITSMFADNKQYAKILADEGQKAARRRIIVSCDVVDILRSADTPHFQSCFQWHSERPKEGGFARSWYDYGYHRVPVQIAEQCPGIGIVYVDDEDGKMMGRHWMHHAKIKETGEDLIVLTQAAYGCLQGENLARLLAARGIRVGLGSYYGQEAWGRNRVAIEYVGCFKESIHHDVDTWSPKQTCVIVPPAY